MIRLSALFDVGRRGLNDASRLRDWKLALPERVLVVVSGCEFIGRVEQTRLAVECKLGFCFMLRFNLGQRVLGVRGACKIYK